MMVKKRRTSGAVISATLKRTRKEGQVAVHLGLSVSASVDYHQVMSSFEQETKGFKFPQAEMMPSNSSKALSYPPNAWMRFKTTCCFRVDSSKISIMFPP
ncbi:unnamed protein product [Linum trigynum]|uniref:Uncharacterized protein n=1 Tax=Linum trigynum TaxID=586398 RepID=A0AAV2FX63_9ROSI